MNRARESNNLNIWGNKESMNLNSMILTNIQSSTYFKTKLTELKTYHEIIDEIYYRVNHLEPWEKGSRRTQGLTGMCGGVRGVGGGGIVSTAFCLLFKLYTLKLTRKQVVGLITHKDSPYIRALGFMYVRYTQNPQDLLNWYYDYLDDEEEVDVKAGGGLKISIGQMLRQWLMRLEWFDTLFPRIPVPIQNEILHALRERYGDRVETASFYEPIGGVISSSRYRDERSTEKDNDRDRDRKESKRHNSRSPGRSSNRRNSEERHSSRRSKSHSRERDRKSEHKRHRSRSKSHERNKKSDHKRHRTRSRSRNHSKHHHKNDSSSDEITKKSKYIDNKYNESKSNKV